MYSGSDPRHRLDAVLKRQEEIREQARLEAMSREVSAVEVTRSPVAFRLWRLHVMLWLDGPRKA